MECVTGGLYGCDGQEYQAIEDAGYAHLHFIVVKGSPSWPYDPVPVAFGNAKPGDRVLREGTAYEAVARSLFELTDTFPFLNANVKDTTQAPIDN